MYYIRLIGNVGIIFPYSLLSTCKQLEQIPTTVYSGAPFAVPRKFGGGQEDQLYRHSRGILVCTKLPSVQVGRISSLSESDAFPCSEDSTLWGGALGRGFSGAGVGG